MLAVSSLPPCLLPRRTHRLQRRTWGCAAWARALLRRLLRRLLLARRPRGGARALLVLVLTHQARGARWGKDVV